MPSLEDTVVVAGGLARFAGVNLMAEIFTLIITKLNYVIDVFTSARIPTSLKAVDSGLAKAQLLFSHPDAHTKKQFAEFAKLRDDLYESCRTTWPDTCSLEPYYRARCCRGCCRSNSERKRCSASESLLHVAVSCPVIDSDAFPCQKKLLKFLFELKTLVGAATAVVLGQGLRTGLYQYNGASSELSLPQILSKSILMRAALDAAQIMRVQSSGLEGEMTVLGVDGGIRAVLDLSGRSQPSAASPSLFIAMCSSASTHAASRSASSHNEFDSGSGKLRDLSVTSMTVHASAKDSSRRHSSSAMGLHKVESISVSSSSENSSCFEVTICTKRTRGRPTTSTSVAREPAYRAEKLHTEFTALCTALRRAVQVTHLLSSCAFCKAVKAHCILHEKELSTAAEAPHDHNKIQPLLDAFTRGIFSLAVPLHQFLFPRTRAE
ncbi:hypothetical protein ON010_g920 [Phytophthora cinnamomi]|nr:hypothetical protein ON010_g920 [Phytophthora cinnamomi]